MKFDYIVQNPPYKRNLHMKFFENGLANLKEDGQMIIIEPSTWLINVRTTPATKKYNLLKDRLEHHVRYVHIENYNNEFGTGLYMPFAITHVDLGRTYDKFIFNCCGDYKQVNSLYDCNLIGPYRVVRSILAKCQAFGDLMKDHVYYPEKL